ncbi:MAG TPA: NADPH:quinone oxidoreductase family protein [Usitatibacter sp.]|nr:NADPH:quinone oxidoreductase family protein [Usitatibacter sp.]
MKALLCRTLTGIDDLRVEEVDAPKPGANEVLVDVAAAGVNFPDVLLAQGKYQFKAPLPFAPGFELAGTVREAGGGVKHLKPGDHVVAIVSHGAFAERCVVPAKAALQLPPGTDLRLAAATLFTYATSYHALKDRAAINPGETLLVLGAAGGVGLAAVELGKRMGARVIAAASTEEKLETCRTYGADETINYAAEDLREGVKRVTGDKGVDVVCDPVGGAYAEAAFRSLAWNGRHLVVGFTAGDIPRLPLNLPLLKGAALVGVFLGGLMQQEPQRARDNARQLVDWVATGAIKPFVSATYSLDQGVDALREVAGRRARGKILIVPGL